MAFFPLSVDIGNGGIHSWLHRGGSGATFSGVRQALKASDHPWQLELPSGNAGTDTGLHMINMDSSDMRAVCIVHLER
jgi:hypothetical protein